MSNYDALIEKLFSFSFRRIRKNLDSIRGLAALLGNPQDHYPSVHVAGTNGKGSVSFKMAKALHLAGYRVGLYSSPHLFSYRERIRVNGEMISKEDVCEGLEKLFTLSQNPQFFELTTLLAFSHFSAKNVDIAIIESGLGGLLDTTNIIYPILSVITTIGFDHQEILGETLEAIATQKGGIIKESTPILTGPCANFSVLREIAQSKKAPFYSLEQGDNEAIAHKALELISPSFAVDAQLKAKAITANPPCRFEVRGNIVLDVAHNPSGFERLFAQIKKRFPNKTFSLLFSFSKEKDFRPLIDLFKKDVGEIALFHSSCLKLKSPLEIAKDLEEGGYHKWKVFAKASHALEYLKNENTDPIITIAGSFYMMKEILA